jgi:hypothetical protein
VQRCTISPAAVDGFQGSHLVSRPCVAVAPSGYLKNFFQRRKFLSRNHHSAFEVTLRVVAKSPRVVSHRQTLNVELEAEAGDAFLRPSPESFLINALNDARTVLDIVKPPALDDVGFGRSSRSCFGSWLHPATKRNSVTKFKAFFTCVMVLLGRTTPKAGAKATATAPAACQKRHFWNGRKVNGRSKFDLAVHLFEGCL